MFSLGTEIRMKKMHAKSIDPVVRVILGCNISVLTLHILFSPNGFPSVHNRAMNLGKASLHHKRRYFQAN